MGHRSCCVVNCKNTSRKSDCKFYKFPTAKWKLNQKEKWIAAVRRQNVDGSPWVPKPYDYICSEHFIGGKKSEEELNPSYIPTIFPSIYKSPKVNESSAINRYNRFISRRQKIQEKNDKKIETTNNKNVLENQSEFEDTPSHNNTGSQATELLPQQKKNVNNKSEQADIYPNYCEAETQTNIFEKN